MKTLNVRQKFEPKQDCLVSFDSEGPTGGSTMLPYSMVQSPS